MNKKLLILIISALTVITIAAAVIGVILYNELAPKDPNTNVTGALPAPETSTNNTTGSKKNNLATEPSIEITKVYGFKNDFKWREFKQSSFYDINSGTTLPYCVFEPEDYSQSKKYPVLLYLHGAGETGTDNVSQTVIMKDAFIVNGDLLKDVIIVCPQSTSWWNSHRSYGDENGPVGAVVRLIESLGDTYNIDENRIYVIGVSMGGYGTWNALSDFPDTFAAGIPICGGGNTSAASILSDIPIWIYHGTADSTVPFSASETMYDAIKAAGGNKIHFTRLQGVNHNCWTTAMTDRELFSWLLSQNKATNKSGDYSVIPNFKIIDENGNTIITDKDAENPYFYYYKEVNVRAQFTLTEDGLEKIKKAYKNGGEFTVIHGNQKLFSYRPSTIEPTNKFKVDALGGSDD